MVAAERTTRFQVCHPGRSVKMSNERVRWREGWKAVEVASSVTLHGAGEGIGRLETRKGE